MTLDPGRPGSPPKRTDTTDTTGPRGTAVRSRAAFAWGLAIVWAVVIWSLGGDGFSMGTTSRFIEPVLELLVPGMSPTDLGRWVVVLRSLAHAFEYGVFALFVYRALRYAPGPSRLRAALFALALCLALAIADETRQAGSAARTGSPLHVGFDLAGAALALGLLQLTRRRLARWSSPPPARSGA